MDIHNTLLDLQNQLSILKEDVQCSIRLINSNYVDFANYVNTAPKGNSQWTEVRLLALEKKFKIMKAKLNLILRRMNAWETRDE